MFRVAMPVLLRQGSKVVSYRPKRVWRGAWRRGGVGGKKTRARSKGKRGENPRKPGKMKKTAKEIGQQLGFSVPGQAGKSAETLTKVYRLLWTTLSLQNPHSPQIGTGCK